MKRFAFTTSFICFIILCVISFITPAEAQFYKYQYQLIKFPYPYVTFLSPLDAWNKRDVLLQEVQRGVDGALNGVAYGDGTFVSVGWNGNAMAYTSPDGINWTRRDIGRSEGLYDVAYGGIFVAVGNDSIIMTSPDGTSWTLRSGPVAGFNALSSVAFAMGRFIAVGAEPWGHGKIMTSTDGIHWSLTVPGSDELKGVAYGRGQIVSVGSNGTIITSVNGTSWTPRSSGTTRTLNRVMYKNGIFVAVGGYDGIILTSSDGINWTQRWSGVTGQWLTGITYGNGYFVVVGRNSTVLTSTNGMNWTERSVVDAGHLSKVAYGDGTFVSVGRYDTGQYASIIETSFSSVPLQTCVDQCGGSGTGGCWCDDWCEYYGDCCPDDIEECSGL